MSTALAKRVEDVVVNGDLANLTSDERVHYYNKICNSIGLNPLTTPFAYIQLNGKLRLYAQKGATDQLRKIHGVSIKIESQTLVDDIYVVTVSATDNTGRTDEDVGSLPLGKLQGEARSNAIMKCITKAKRRVTLSICGLGMLDESEIESIPHAVPVPLDSTKRFKEQAANENDDVSVQLLLSLLAGVTTDAGLDEWIDKVKDGGFIGAERAQLLAAYKAKCNEPTDSE